MKKAQRRVPRKIGGDEEEDGAEPNGSPAVIKPVSGATKRSLPTKTSSKSSIKLPHRVPLSEATSTPRTQTQSLYTPEALSELKNSTPRVPASSSLLRSTVTDVDAPTEETSPAVDIASKFGSSYTPTPQTTSKSLITNDTSSLIPSAAEIAEKKARRARIRLEQSALDPHERDFISLHSSSKPGTTIRRASDASSRSSRSSSSPQPGQGNLIIAAEEFNPADKYGRRESRLQHEDEDIAEGFDDFVEDTGRVTLSKRGKKEQEAERKRQIEKTIRRAERGDSASSSSDDDDVGDEDDEDAREEKQRVAAYEAAQTAAGTYGSRHTGSAHRDSKEAYERLRRRLEVPTKLPPIPTPKDIKTRFRDLLAEKEAIVKRSEEQLKALEREKEELAEEEQRVKAALDEAAAKFEKVRQELSVEAQKRDGSGGFEEQGRGLENLGGLSAPRPVSRNSPETESPTRPMEMDMRPPAVPSGMAGRHMVDEDDYY